MFDIDIQNDLEKKQAEYEANMLKRQKRIENKWRDKK